MEMDEAPSLELGDLDEGETREVANLGPRHVRSGREEPTHANGRPAPQSPGVGVPDYGPGIVVAVGTERLTDRRIVLAMADTARDRPAVDARCLVGSPVTGQDRSHADHPAMDSAERWCGQG